MIKKFLATLAVMGLFLTPVASAVTATMNDQFVSNLQVSRTTFNPSAGERVTASFNVVANTNVFAYVISSNTGAIDAVFANRVPVYGGLSQSYTWSGSEINGVYMIKVISFNSVGTAVDYDEVAVTVANSTSVPAITAPVISGLSITPSTFNARNGETANIDFSVNKTAYLTVTIYDGSTVVRKFINYDDVANSYSAGSRRVIWDGKSNAGLYVNDGVYTVRVSASNALGADVETTSVTVANSTPATTAPVISGLSATPNTFDAKDGETTNIDFSINNPANLTVTVRDGSTIIRRFANYDASIFYAVGSQRVTWNGKNDAGFYVNDGVYTVSVAANNGGGSDVETTSVTVGTTVVNQGVIDSFTLNPSSTWDPNEETLEMDYDLNDDVNSLEIVAKKGNVVVELVNDRYVDADNYTQEWDGTDEDGDYVAAGTWNITIDADGDVITRSINVEYQKPGVSSAFVSKSSFDPNEDEFTYLVFELDTDSLVTVDVYNGSRREVTLIDEEELDKNTWYAVKWDGTDEDGDIVDEGTGWEFRIKTENPLDSKTYTVETVGFTVADESASNRASNATQDSLEPVIFDSRVDNEATFSYCIDEDAEVYLAVYKGSSTSGSAQIELLDYVDQSAGCYTETWNGEDKDGDALKDGFYSYKLITKVDSYKDTETGKFVVGEGDNVSDKPNPPNPPTGECGNEYWDVQANVNTELCEAITWATDAGIFSGYNDGSFRPYTNINRAEVLRVVFEAFRSNVTMLPSNGTNLGFKDVDSNAWYMTYARTAKFYGMLHGYINQTEARLANNINRVEFLKFVLEASDAFTAWETPGHERSYYADVDANEPTHDWFFDYAGVARTYGLYNDYYDNETGERYLNPGSLVQRGEVALLLYRMNKAGLLD